MNSLRLAKTLLGSSSILTRSLARNQSSAAYTSRYSDFEYLQVSSPHDHVLHVELNRPDKRNALTRDAFRELTEVFNEITADQQCRAVVLSGSGKMFCAGIDFMDLMEAMSSQLAPIESGDNCKPRDDVAGRAKYIRYMVELLQQPFNAMAKCPKPVLAAIHNGCIGAGVDMVSACDVRYASKDAYFSIREVALGMAADVGTLQRLPKIVGNDSLVRDLSFTGRDLPAPEALQFGLISKIYDNRDQLIQGSLESAKNIAALSPVAVQGTKIALNYSRDHTISDGLEFMQIWNASMLQSEDLLVASTAVATKSTEKPEFADL